MTRGTIDSQWKLNPKTRSADVWARMVELVREIRDTRRKASSRFCSATLTKEFGVKVHHSTIARTKKVRGFKNGANQDQAATEHPTHERTP